MSPAPTAACLMDGTAVSRAQLAETAQRADRSTGEAGRPPCLAAVLVGEGPASVTDVKMKRARCKKAGIDSRLVRLPAYASTAEAVGAVCDLSQDPPADGILVQHPVPAQVDERQVFEAIAPTKDVDVYRGEGQ